MTMAVSSASEVNETVEKQHMQVLLPPLLNHSTTATSLIDLFIHCHHESVFGGVIEEEPQAVVASACEKDGGKQQPDDEEQNEASDDEQPFS